MKAKKQPEATGLPVSFLDALGLALAAILLLMFTNLSALQSAMPPKDTKFLYTKACFTNASSSVLWGMKWMYKGVSLIESEQVRLTTFFNRTLVL